MNKPALGRVNRASQNIPVSLSSAQFDRLAKLLEHKPESPWASWIKPVLVPVLITFLGALAAQQITEHYSEHEAVLAQAQAGEKYLSYFEDKKTGQERYLAIQSLIQIGSYDAAADLLVSLGTNYSGTAAALATHSKNLPSTDKGESQANCVSSLETTSDPSADKACPTPASTQDDKLYAAALLIYFRPLLPRLCYLAGLPIDHGEEVIGSADSTSNDNSKSIQRKNLEAIKLLMLTPEGRDAVSKVAFPKSVREDGSIAQVEYFWKERFAARWMSSDSSDASQQQQLGALRAVRAVIEETRQLVASKRYPDSLLRIELRPYNGFSGPLVRLASYSAQPILPESRVDSVRALAALDPSFVSPCPCIKPLMAIVFDKNVPLTVRDQSLEVVLQARNVTQPVVETLNDLILAPSTREKNDRTQQLLVNFAHYVADGGSMPEDDPDEIPTVNDQHTLANLFLPAFTVRLDRNNEEDDGLVSAWLRLHPDFNPVLKNFSNLPEHRQLIILQSLRVSPVSKSPDVIALAGTESHDSGHPKLQDAAYGILMSVFAPGRGQDGFSNAVKESNPLVLQRALRAVKRFKACATAMDPLKNTASSIPSISDRLVTLELWQDTKNACDSKTN